MERVIWSVVLVLAWVASVTMLTWHEFVVAVLVATPCAMLATKLRRAIAGREPGSSR